MSTFTRADALRLAKQQAARGNVGPAAALATPHPGRLFADATVAGPAKPKRQGRPRPEPPEVAPVARLVGAALHLTLPVPPSANRYWRKTKRGNTYVGDEAKAYRALISRACAGVRPLDGDVLLVVRWVRFRAEGDLSNRIKILEDALRGVAFHDDKQVWRIEAERADDKSTARVEVVVRPRGGPQA